MSKSTYVLLLLVICCAYAFTGQDIPERTAAVRDDLREQKAQTKSPAIRQKAERVPASALGTDKLVNNNTGSTGTASFTQSETDILAFGNNIVIGFNDGGSYNGSNNQFTGWSYSTDGGGTFTDGGTLPTSTVGDAGDPVLARNETTGRIYFSTLGFSGSGTIQMWRSDDNGVTWMAPVNATPGGSSEDKQWHVVDNFPGTGNGNVYMISRSFGAPSGIYVFRSTDHGATFGPSGGVNIVSGMQGAYVVVGTDHSVYAFWFDGTADQIRVRKSTDFGATFGAAVTVVSGLVGGTNGDLSLTGLRQGVGTFSSFRSNQFPHVSLNPVSGHLYVVYNNDGAGADKADVHITTSTDGGATWSSPTKVNDDATTTDQWQPTIAVTPDGGRLGVFYYSRQEDPDSNNEFKYYGRIASISGSTLTFATSFAISDVPSLPEFGRDSFVNSVYMGDYSHAVATADAFHVVWSDNRDNLSGGAPRKDPNVYYDKIVLADPVDPNPPTNVLATSDFTTPTSIALSWTNPTTLVNGSPIGSFVMRIKRDGVQIAEVTPPTATYNDGGRTTYQSYTYTLQTRLTANDSLSSAVEVTKIAGGSPTPSAPSNVGIVITSPTVSTQATISWTNPTTQDDGTPIHDFGGTRIWRNGALIDSVGSGSTQYIDTPPQGFVYTYQVQAYNTLVPRRYSALSLSVGGYVGSTPDILIWQPSDAISQSGDSLSAALTRLGKSSFKTDSLFEFGSDLSVYDAIFAVVGIYSNNHVILASDPEGPALNTYVTNGGKLYLEGGDVFNYDPESAGGYQVRPIFGLNDGSDGGADVTSVNGVGLLGGMNFTYSGGNNFMDELHPNGDNAARTMLVAPGSTPANDTMAVYAFYGTGRSVAMVTEFGGLVNTAAEAGNKDSLLSKILQFFNASNSAPEIDISPLSIADTLQSNETNSKSFTISNTTLPPSNLIVGISEGVAWLSVSPTADTISGSSNASITVNFDATGLTPATYNTNVVVTSNDPSEPSTNVAITLVVTPSPTLVTVPDSITKVLAPNIVVTDTLVIKNTGGASLTWSIEETFGQPNVAILPQPQADELYPPRRGRDGWVIPYGKDEKDPRVGTPVAEGSGGPDSAGYRWIDSDEPGGPVFDWLDITTLGDSVPRAAWLSTTGTPNADDGRVIRDIPFPFTYYGNTFDSVKLVTNGWISFTTSNTSTTFSNVAIPATAAPNDAVYPLWDDLDLRNSGQVNFYHDVANNRFIIQYTNVPHYGTTPPLGPYTFQVILYADGRILFQYLDVNDPVNSATVGMENGSGTVGLQVVFNAAYLHDNLAVLLAKDVSWISENPTSGTVAPGDSVKVVLTFDTNGLSPAETDYTAALQIESNDFANTPKTIPIHLIVGSSTVGVPIQAGWNLVSNPVITTDDSVKQLFPTSSFDYAFEYTPGSGYSQEYILQNGKGYWEKFSAGTTALITGSFILADTISVVDGWNILGSISSSIDTGNVTTIPSGLRTSPFFGFASGYTPASTIVAGLGYWMKANGAGSVILSTTLKPASAPAIGGGTGFEQFSSITISDSKGGAQTLYLGEHPGENFEMPPAGPLGVFDARFSSQRMVESILPDLRSKAEFPISIQSTAYPLTVTWNVRSEHRLTLRDGINGNILAARAISGTGQAVVSNPSVARLVVAAEPTAIPTVFALSQNYPNPFNPSTRITYGLPEAATVTLKVFDVLGQEVSSLVAGPQEAGYYSLEWDGRNNSGTQLASGIYFYTFDAVAGSGQTFRSTKKMTLMK